MHQDRHRLHVVDGRKRQPSSGKCHSVHSSVLSQNSWMLAQVIREICFFCCRARSRLTHGVTSSDWVHMSCGSSFVAGSVSSSMGSTCSINSGRVSMATPSFGTYYLAQSSTVTAAPAPQTIAALPPAAQQPSPVPVATQPSSPVELTDRYFTARDSRQSCR
jgi:hypothetical protein